MDIDASPELVSRRAWGLAAWRTAVAVVLVGASCAINTIWHDVLQPRPADWITPLLLAGFMAHGLITRRFRKLEVMAVAVVIVVLGAGLVWPAWQKVLDKGMVNLIFLFGWVAAGLKDPSEPPLATAITSVRRAACRCGGCARPLTDVPPGADGCRECPKCGSAWKC